MVRQSFDAIILILLHAHINQPNHVSPGNFSFLGNTRKVNKKYLASIYINSEKSIHIHYTIHAYFNIHSHNIHAAFFNFSILNLFILANSKETWLIFFSIWINHFHTIYVNVIILKRLKLIFFPFHNSNKSYEVLASIGIINYQLEF